MPLRRLLAWLRQSSPARGSSQGRVTLAPAGTWYTSAAFVVTLGMLLTTMPPAAADVYVYTDGAGVNHYTNNPDHARYRRLFAMMEREGEDNRAHAPVTKGSAEAYAPYVEQVAAEEGVDAALVHAVITAESGYNPSAVSKAGAMGLMQLMPQTARRYHVRDVFNPRDNIRGGTRYLRDLLDLFGNDLKLALAAYNAGENAVIRNGLKVPPYHETRVYVSKVLRLFKEYESL